MVRAVEKEQKGPRFKSSLGRDNHRVTLGGVQSQVDATSQGGCEGEKREPRSSQEASRRRKAGGSSEKEGKTQTVDTSVPNGKQRGQILQTSLWRPWSVEWPAFEGGGCKIWPGLDTTQC